MNIIEVTENKKQYLDLLLLTDEQEDMIDKYLNRGSMYALIEESVICICEKYKQFYRMVQVGTGDSPLTIPFYEKCGFKRSHIIQNFFIDHYDHPIYEEGKQLIDMVYLRKMIS